MMCELDGSVDGESSLETILETLTDNVRSTCKAICENDSENDKCWLSARHIEIVERLFSVPALSFCVMKMLQSFKEK